jgi:RNA-dependent RNA polymerase
VVLHSMDITASHFGYQISKETFSVLWKQEDVSASFNLKMRKLFFLSDLSDLSEQYKLEFSFDSIRQIKLHQPRGQPTKFLLIQVCLLLNY